MMKEKILEAKTYLGIEMGSTRIKAVLIDDTFAPVASGSFEWENRFENGYWTYSLDDIHRGIKECFKSISQDILEKYGVHLKRVGAIGISAMMHGYLAFDKDGNLLVPFRTWRNTKTEQAANELTELFGFNIPQRWSIAHLYQAILNNEPHVSEIAYITTLSGYIHYLLTGRLELGIGDASGMFPIKGDNYDGEMLKKFDSLVKGKGYSWSIDKILPEVKLAGEKGAILTETGAKFLDPTGTLEANIPMCPPEGDAGTGMVATNSVLAKTGNISAGTSIFSMLVLEKQLCGLYPEIDIVTTPGGNPVAMVHCNNCCGELDAWVNIFGEFAEQLGVCVDKSKLYETLYTHAMTGDVDCGGVLAYNYLSGEHITRVTDGRPMYFRMPDAKMTLANFMRAELYSAFASLTTGMEILFEKEGVSADEFLAHGGLFKIPGVSQKILADAVKTPVSVMETAGEGGAWGMALLAAYMENKKGDSLGCWLKDNVFANMQTLRVNPDEKGMAGFGEYMTRYKAGLSAERELGEVK